MPSIKLQSSDGEIFEVDIEIAKASNTIKTMLEGEFTPIEVHHFTLVAQPTLYAPRLLRSQCLYRRELIKLVLNWVCSSHSTYIITDLGMNDEDDEAVPLPNVSGAIMKKVSEQSVRMHVWRVCT